MNKNLIALALLSATALPLAACGNKEELGRTINSNGYTFQEVKGYPFVLTTGAGDCDESDYIERDTDCGFPAGYAKKHKVKKAKKAKKAKKSTIRKSTSSVKPTIRVTKPVATKPRVTKPTIRVTKPTASNPVPSVKVTKPVVSAPKVSKPTIQVSKPAVSAPRSSGGFGKRK